MSSCDALQSQRDDVQKQNNKHKAAAVIREADLMEQIAVKAVEKLGVVHPNIIEILGRWDNGKPGRAATAAFLIMEIGEFGDLDHCLEKANATRFKIWIVDACQGIIFLHNELRLVHFDLKDPVPRSTYAALRPR